MRLACICVCLTFVGCGEPDSGGPAGSGSTRGDTGTQGSTEDPSDPSAPADDDADESDADATTDPDPDPTTTTATSTDDSSSGEPPDPPAEVPPMGLELLLPWLEAGEYLDWAPESAPHASAGPHFGGVRTFVNAQLLGSLEADGDPHPLEAAAVKELYGDGDAVLGWAVSIKVAEGSGGDTWYWFEHYEKTTYADGIGDTLCTDCHGMGTDHVLTPYPLQ